MGRKKKQSCAYSNLNPTACEFFPAVVSSCDGKYSSDKHASYRRDIPKSSRPSPYSNNNEELSFSFLETDDSGTIEINEPRVDFVSELSSLVSPDREVVKKILQHLDVTTIQNCRRVSRRWNDVIIELQPNVIKDIERDGDFIRRLIDSRLSNKLPEEPFYQDRKCANCAIDEHYRDNMWAFKHDLIKLITYHYYCEDKSKKYDCPHCPDWFVKEGDSWSDEFPESDEDEEYEEYDEDSSRGWREWEEEDFQRRPAKVISPPSPVRRHFRSLGKHFAHLFLRHDEEITQFLLNKQKLFPLPMRCPTDNRDDHHKLLIDKLTEDMIFQGDGYFLLSD